MLMAKYQKTPFNIDVKCTYFHSTELFNCLESMYIVGRI